MRHFNVWHHSFCIAGIMKTLSLNIKNKTFAQEAINCWLRYTLSQPITIDLSMLIIFAVQYFGIAKVIFLLEHAHKMMSFSFQIVTNKISLSDPLTFGLSSSLNASLERA